MRRSSGQELDDLIEGVVGFTIGRLDFGQRRSGLGGAALEQASGQRTADPLMEEHEEQGRAASLGSQAIGVAAAVRSSRPWAFILRRS